MTMTNLMTQIAISISEVMETMFYIPVEPRNGYTTICESGLFLDNLDHPEHFKSIFKSGKRVAEADNIQAATITFHGTFSGEICLIVPEKLLVVMTENFMGEERRHLTDEHLDGTLKETLNMLAGNTFSKIDTESSFCLGVPETNTSAITSSDKKGWYANSPLLLVDTMDGLMGITVNIK